MCNAHKHVSFATLDEQTFVLYENSDTSIGLRKIKRRGK